MICYRLLTAWKMGNSSIICNKYPPQRAAQSIWRCRWLSPPPLIQLQPCLLSLAHTGEHSQEYSASLVNTSGFLENSVSAVKQHVCLSSLEVSLKALVNHGQGYSLMHLRRDFYHSTVHGSDTEQVCPWVLQRHTLIFNIWWRSTLKKTSGDKMLHVSDIWNTLSLIPSEIRRLAK